MAIVHGVYNPELDQVTLAVFPNEPASDFVISDTRARFGQCLALLATGLDDPKKVGYHLDRVVDGVYDEYSAVVPNASKILSPDNFQRVHDGTVFALIERRIAVTTALSELDLLQEFSEDSMNLFDDRGLVLAEDLRVWTDSTDNSFCPDSTAGRLVEELGLEATAVQVEYFPEDFTLRSDVIHVSIGNIVDGEYLPIVTVLDKKHTVHPATEA